jgi:hypothetical protein
LKCNQYLCTYCCTFKPDQPTTTFTALKREWRVAGLFLSSGIVPDADRP